MNSLLYFGLIEPHCEGGDVACYFVTQTKRGGSKIIDSSCIDAFSVSNE